MITGERNKMPFDNGPAFRFMQMNYKYGLLDEMGSIVGDALEAALREKGMDTEDAINLLDGADEATVERLDLLVQKWGALFFRLAANEPMTRVQAFLIKKPFVRRRAVRFVERFLSRKLSAGKTIPCGSQGGLQDGR